MILIIILIIDCCELLCFEKVELCGWMVSTPFMFLLQKKPYTTTATDFRVPELRYVVQEGFE